MDDEELPKEWVPRLRDARGTVTVADEVGLALRAHRRQLALSQRAYAAARGLSRARVARLESGAGRMSLDTVVTALHGTGFALHVSCAEDDGPEPDGGAGALAVKDSEGHRGHLTGRRVPREAWVATDLVARVRGGGRRFPAHRQVLAVTNPPLWWWMHEFFKGPSEEPKWYAPVCHLERTEAASVEDDQADRGAA